MRSFILYCIVLLMLTAIHDVRSQCESQFGAPVVVQLAGEGIEVSNSMDFAGPEASFDIVFVGQANGDSEVLINGNPTGDSISADREVFNLAINYDAYRAWFAQTIDIDDALPAIQRVRAVPGGFLIAGSVTTRGNCDPEGSTEGEVFCQGISNGVVPMYSNNGVFGSLINIGGSDRVIAMDAIQDKVNGNLYVLINFQDTVDLSESVQLVSEGGWDSAIICYDENNAYFTHAIISSEDDVQLNNLHLTSIQLIDTQVTIYATGTADYNPLININNEFFLDEGEGGTEFVCASFDVEPFTGMLDAINAIVVGNAADQGAVQSDVVVIGEGGSNFASNGGEAETLIGITGYFRDSIDLDPGKEVQQYYSEGSIDMFIACYNDDLELIWGTTAGSPGLDEGLAVTFDASGNLYCTGRFSDTIMFSDGDVASRFSNNAIELISSGKHDIPLVKFNPVGKLLDGIAFGGPGFDGGTGVKVDTLNNVYVTGFFKDSVDFDPGPDTNMIFSQGQDDAFAVRFIQACTGGSESVAYDLSAVPFVGALGDPNNYKDTIAMPCGECTLRQLEWANALVNFSPESNCSHLYVQVRSLPAGDTASIQLLADDFDCDTVLDGTRQVGLQLKDAGLLEVEFYVSVDVAADAVDAAFTSGILNFQYCNTADTCALGLDSLVTGACDPASDSFELQLYLNYSSVLPVVDSVIITTFNTTRTHALHNSGQTQINLTFPADSSLQDLKLQLWSDTSCFVFIPEAYTSPAMCSLLCMLEIDTILRGDCIPSSDSFEIQVSLNLSNPFLQDIILDLDGDEYLYAAQVSSGNDTIAALVPADGSVGNLARVYYSASAICENKDSAIYSARGSCADCEIELIQVLKVGDCNKQSNTYLLMLDLAYTGNTSTDVEFALDGQQFFQTLSDSGRDTVSVEPKATGAENVSIQVQFTERSTCADTLTKAYNAPDSCKTTALRDPINTGIRIYPNPANDKLFVDLSSNRAQEMTINITNIQGKEYLRHEVDTGLGASVVSLGIANLTTGIYLLNVITSHGNQSFRWIKL